MQVPQLQLQLHMQRWANGHCLLDVALKLLISSDFAPIYERKYLFGVKRAI